MGHCIDLIRIWSHVVVSEAITQYTLTAHAEASEINIFW